MADPDLVGLDSADPDSVDLEQVGLDQVDPAQADRDPAEPERATSAQGNRAVQVKAPEALEARERPAVGVTRHRESERHALRAPALVPWPSKPG